MLLHFSGTGALPLGKIGERLQVQAGSVTNAIDRLEADGLVERRPHDTDGRATLAVITPSGPGSRPRRDGRVERARFRAAVDVVDRQTRDAFGVLRSMRVDAGDFVPTAT